MTSYRKTPFPIGNTDENWQYHRLGDFRESRRIREFHPRAEDLVLSKSEVSKQIVGLEERLGARLLNRTTRRLSVTNTGARLFERCQSIVAEIEAAELEAGELHYRPTGVLRLTAGMSLGHLHLASAISAFLGAYPELDVELALNDRIVDLIDKAYDPALRISMLETSSMLQRRLSDIRLLTVTSQGYLERHGEPRHPS